MMELSLDAVNLTHTFSYQSSLLKKRTNAQPFNEIIGILAAMTYLAACVPREIPSTPQKKLPQSTMVEMT